MGEHPLPSQQPGIPVPLLNSNLLLYAQCQEAYFPMVHRDPVLYIVSAHTRSPVALKEKECQFPSEGKKVVTCYSAFGTGDLLSKGAQRPNAPHYVCLRQNPCSLIQKQETPPPRSVTEKRKAVICTTRILPWHSLVHSVRFPECLSLKKTSGTPGEKAQNPNHSGTKG
jgi:hypothetical protein